MISKKAYRENIKGPRHEPCGSPWRRTELTERETLMHTRRVRPERQDRGYSNTAAVVFQATNASFFGRRCQEKVSLQYPDCLKSNAEDTHA